LEDAKGRKDFK